MIISGDLELKATMLGDISTSREVGPQDEMRGNFRQQVIDAVNCVNVENKITDATAFIVTRDEANQIDVTRVELLRTTAAKPDERSVMTDHLRYGFEEEQGWKFYRNMCELTEHSRHNINALAKEMYIVNGKKILK